MKYLIDTDLLFGFQPGQLEQAGAERAWRNWVRRNDAEIGFSAVTVLEIRLKARELRATGTGMADRASGLERWAAAADFCFADKILPLTEDIAALAQKLRTHTRHTGLVPSAQDAVVAATALAHGLELVALNTQTMASTVFRLGQALGLGARTVTS